ncbi:DUF1636 domain-containing protein [Rhizobium alvei]|uniref:DUF1636 domain-containing protein n=1 Tax=Rhizobium alvei TaxID=1132659 RepID=A0ABT8YQE4_9HYPH|nr:DUF1636 domain-containing protein [Rhizobium alvei]MDO6965940.1 DUF1636 domain-containing protein [Rhizobium alvei]
MSKHAYTIHVCDRCGTDKVRDPQAINDLTEQLASKAEDCGARVVSVRCMAGCERPMVVGFTAPDKASYLFGDIDPVNDIPALLAFGALYSRLDDGWCNEGHRPEGLRGKTLARIPASGGWNP